MTDAHRTGLAAYIVAIAFLAFLGGAYVVLARVFPYEFLRNSYRAGESLIEQYRIRQDRYTLSNMWREAVTDRRGVTRHLPGAHDGYTLYTSGDGTYAALIDMAGREVHRWQRPYSSVWDTSANGGEPMPDDFFYWRKARALPNGDLVAIYIAGGETPWGMGMVRLDRNSEVIWSYHEPTHHDFDFLPDGRIVALTHEFTSEVIERHRALERPRLDDFLVLLSPEGRELRKVSLTRAVARSPYRRLLGHTPHFALEDPLHTNSVAYVDSEAAAVFPFAEEGQFLLSLREPRAIGILDAEREVFTWMTSGPWLGQHSARILGNGNLLLFDNFGHFEKRNEARVIEIDPKTLGIVWRHAGDAGAPVGAPSGGPLHSPLRGAAERLANGNTLITESDGGRLLEVSPQGELVWEFVNPVRGGPEGDLIPVVSWAQRLTPDELTPDFRDFLQATRR